MTLAAAVVAWRCVRQRELTRLASKLQFKEEYRDSLGNSSYPGLDSYSSQFQELAPPAPPAMYPQYDTWATTMPPQGIYPLSDANFGGGGMGPSPTSSSINPTLQTGDTTPLSSNDLLAHPAPYPYANTGQNPPTNNHGGASSANTGGTIAPGLDHPVASAGNSRDIVYHPPAWPQLASHTTPLPSAAAAAEAEQAAQEAEKAAEAVRAAQEAAQRVREATQAAKAHVPGGQHAHKHVTVIPWTHPVGLSTSATTTRAMSTSTTITRATTTTITHTSQKL